MLKKIFAHLSCFLVIVFLWVIWSYPTFINYSNNSEIYQNKNNSCAKIVSVKNVDIPLQFYRYGEACEVNKEQFNLDQIINDFNATILWMETTDFGKSYYAYSKDLKYSCHLKGQKVNLQIFVGKENVKLASPIIFGSY